MSETDDGRLAFDIEILAELFKANGWRELRVESETLSLLISNDRATPSLGGGVIAVTSAAPADTASVRPADIPAPESAPVVARSDGAVDPAWMMITAPNLGTFYRSPKPGSAPFVDIGQRVETNTEICLLEVMKLFTSVQAGVAGTVRYVAVADGELVEGGQALIYIERD